MKANLNEIKSAAKFVVDCKQDPAIVAQKDSVGPLVDLIEERLSSKRGGHI
jgi:hypothetical protein